MIPAPQVKLNVIGFRESGQFAKRDIAYAEQDEALLKFVAHPASLAGLGAAMQARQDFACDRQTLVSVIQDQYAAYGIKPKARPKAIETLLEPNSFSVVTAHQASLFLGPLYYVYKILSAVSLSLKLAETYPESQFVPVFVLGAEDHDLEEIDHLTVGGQRIQWATSQTGPTGEMTLQGIEKARQAVIDCLGESSAAQRLEQLLEKCYRPERTLAVATGHFVAELFTTYGVVVANLNDARLKKNFAPYIKREVLEQVSRPLIDETVTRLEALGHSQQAHAREINFFYLQPGRRDRIERTLKGYEVLDTDLVFSDREMAAEIDAHPERFSPNVVMRPLLQEVSLPNIAYVGGGGELAYWQERATLFAAFEVPMPVLVRRDSAWWITDTQVKQLAKLSLKPADLLGDKHQLMRRYVSERSEQSVDFSGERETIKTLMSGISASAGSIDETLRAHVLAKAALLEKDLVKLEKRLVRELKKRESDAMHKIESLYAELLPGGGLQERRDSFMNLYARHGNHFFDILLSNFDPLDMRLKVFIEE